MESLPGVFDMLQYLQTILSRVEILKIRYILRVVALLEACDVTRNGRHLGCHLGFHQELESGLNHEKWQFFVLYMKNNL